MEDGAWQAIEVVERPWPFSDFVFDTASFESVGADPADGPCLHFSGFALVIAHGRVRCRL